MKNSKAKFNIYPVKLNFYYTRIIFIAMLVFLAFEAGEAKAATRIFYENYDDTPSEQTSLEGVIANSEFDHIGRTNGTTAEGDHAIIQENYDGGQGYCHRVNHGNEETGLQDQWEDLGESLTGEHYISYWYRLDSTYDLSNGWSHKNLRFWHSEDPNMDDIVMEMHIYGTYAMDIGPQVNLILTDGSRWGFLNEPDHASEFNSEEFEWHHVEIWIKYDSPAGEGNGEMKVWIDEVLQVDKNNVIFTKTEYPSYTRFSVPSNMTITDAPAPNYYFVDEVEIWDGLPDSDTTPPSAPSGLSVS